MNRSRCKEQKLRKEYNKVWCLKRVQIQGNNMRLQVNCYGVLGCMKVILYCVCVLATSSPSLYRINKFIFDKYV